MEASRPQSSPEQNLEGDLAKIIHLPVEARVAYAEFRATRSARALDVVVLAILQSYLPEESARGLGTMPGTASLARDLGLDSIGVAEVVFFAEDLFEITISNDELSEGLTLDELRVFIRRKVNARDVA